jgi:hypothetical protein
MNPTTTTSNAPAAGDLILESIIRSALSTVDADDWGYTNGQIISMQKKDPTEVEWGRPLDRGGHREGRVLGGHSKRRRRNIDHVRAGAALRRRLGPTDIALEIGGGSCGLRQRNAELLLIFWGAAR